MNKTKPLDSKEQEIDRAFSLIKESVFKKCAFHWTEPIPDEESREYGAFTFTINHLSTLYRHAKVTPTKIGQFVTLWKRSAVGPIAPFHVNDSIDLVLITTRKGNHLGQFIFPKSILIQKGIFSTDSKDGKRAFRLYPPWDVPTSRQAQRTQKWQLDYFLALDNGLAIEVDRVRRFYFRD